MATTEKLVWFYSVCLQNGIRLADDQLGLIGLFVSRLLEWNKKVNVISRRDEENVWERHILHSVCLLFKVMIPQGARVLDLGSGGGLPGVPLKIVRPDLSVTMLDATQKKVNVVRDILGSLGLAGVSAVWGRAEDLGKEKEHSAQYDVVVARAVAPLKELARWSRPFLKRGSLQARESTPIPGGSARLMVSPPTLIAFKGGELESEIRQLRDRTDIGSVSTIELSLAGSTQLQEGDKKIVVVEFAKR